MNTLKYGSGHLGIHAMNSKVTGHGSEVLMMRLICPNSRRQNTKDLDHLSISGCMKDLTGRHASVVVLA
jgi:hypothetical protein